MNIANIKKLIKLVESSQINELEVQDQDLQVRIVKSVSVTQTAPAQIVPVHASHATPTEFTTHIQEAKVEAAKSAGQENVVEVLSPMVGTFYRSPAPDAAVYINEGDMIKPGQILCIIEAMKLMNEIEAEISGKVVKILAENSQPVEYNQPLFLVERM